jgi:hypothetical protein
VVASHGERKKLDGSEKIRQWEGEDKCAAPIGRDDVFRITTCRRTASELCGVALYLFPTIYAKKTFCFSENVLGFWKIQMLK